MLEPQGPLPPSVYWRRRAVAIVGAVVLLGLGVWGVSAVTGGGDEAVTAAPAEPAPTPRPASFAQAAEAEQAAREGRTAPDARSGRAVTTVEPEAAQDDAEGGKRREAQESRGRQDGQQDGQASPRSGSPQGAQSRPAPAASGSPSPPAPLFAPPSGAGRALLPGSVLGPLPSQGSTAAGAPPAAIPPTTTPPLTGAPSGRSAPAAPPATPAAPPAAVAPCPDSAIAVNARTDKPRYAPGEKPVFSLVITNTGTTACSRDLDAARQAVAVVRTPGDGLWGSDDCSPASTDDVRTLRPGEQVVFSVRWSRLASMPGCPKPRSAVGPGTYQLLTRLDGTISEPARFTLQG